MQKDVLTYRWSSSTSTRPNTASILQLRSTPGIETTIIDTSEIKGEGGERAGQVKSSFNHSSSAAAASRAQLSKSKTQQRESPSRGQQRFGYTGRTSSQSVQYNHDQHVLPPHIKSIVQLINKNLDALQHFSTHFVHFTNSEMHASSLRLNALLTSQNSCMHDLMHFTAQEIKHGKERINDLNMRLRDGREDLGRQLATLKAIYTTVTCLTNITNASEGLVFLYPHAVNQSSGMKVVAHHDWRDDILDERKQKNASEEEEKARQKKNQQLPTKDSPVTTTSNKNTNENDGVQLLNAEQGGSRGGSVPMYSSHVVSSDDDMFSASNAKNLLLLGAHVSNTNFDPLVDGSTLPDIYNICRAVGKSSCATNIHAISAGPPRQFETLVACPIFLPQHSTTVLGVVCVVNKISQFEANFSKEDESRVLYAAEQIAELLVQLPLVISLKATLPITPASFQTEWQQWSQDYTSTGVGTQVRDPISKKFIFRTAHDGVALQQLEFRSRYAIEASDVMTDVLDRYRILEEELKETSSRLTDSLAKVARYEQELQSVRHEARVAVLQSADLQSTNERVLRDCFLHARQLEESERKRQEVLKLSQEGQILLQQQKGQEVSEGLDAGGKGSPSLSSIRSISPRDGHRSGSSLTTPRPQSGGGGNYLSSASALSHYAESQEKVKKLLKKSQHRHQEIKRILGEKNIRKSPSVGREASLGGDGSRGADNDDDNEIVDVSKLPDDFIRDTQKMRNKSFFPTPPPPWNPKSKAVLGGSFLK